MLVISSLHCQRYVTFKRFFSLNTDIISEIKTRAIGLMYSTDLSDTMNTKNKDAQLWMVNLLKMFSKSKEFLKKRFLQIEGTLSSLRQFLAPESPLGLMKKNIFFFTLKLFLFSRYLIYCLDFLVMLKNSLIRKIRLISKFMTSQPG